MTRDFAQLRTLPLDSLNRAARVGIHILLLALLVSLTACKGNTDTAPPSPQVKAPVPPAPRPTATMPADATCVTEACHATYLTAAHIHGPVSQGSCKSCHAADQGNHKFPLIRTGNATCTFCHAVAGTKAHQHKALDISTKGGGCLGCHDPHISKAKFLLAADTVDALCAKCHNVQLKKFAHQPFAAGQCTVCHQAHQSDFASLLRTGEGAEHCFGCHNEKRVAFAQSSHIHKASQQNCTICHGAHATDYAKQLKVPVNDTCLACHKTVREQLAAAKNIHGAVTQGNCAACHDPHASQQPAELKARADKLCLTCHDKDVKTNDGRTIRGMTAVLASTNLHGPVKSGNCSACHQPHAADQPNLLKQYFPDTFYATFDVNNYALCFSCHDKQVVLQKNTTVLTNFRDGDKNLHFIHVNRAEKGRTCKTCHEIHGSDLPKHMASSVPFEGSNWAMPIHYEQAQNGGSCTPGCHEMKTYDRTKAPTQTTQSTRGAP